jgi:23S rRNA pseudouridine1911/1915/1917 synthase
MLNPEIPILFENESFLFIDKPSGLSVHQDGVTEHYTLSEWIWEKYPALHDVGEDMRTEKGIIVYRPGIVHRLDKETSGVLLIAKTKEAFSFAKKAFQERAVQKVYRGIVYGVLKKDEGEISIPIGRSTQDPRKRAAKKKGKVREAQTAYKVLSRYENYSYLEIYPKTGRTHQIRVHLNSIGYPIVCDSLYAEKLPCPEELGRLALHALSLSFILPNKERISVLAQVPSAFTRFLEKQKAL